MANILRTVIENDKGELKKLDKIAKKVDSYADHMAALSDEALQAKTPEFKERYQNGETLDQLLPEVSFFTMVIFQKCVLVREKL